MFNSIELQADELVFDETDINYFIGIDNGSNRISWEPITPCVATELNIMETNVPWLAKQSRKMAKFLNVKIYSYVPCSSIPPVRTLSEQEDVSSMLIVPRFIGSRVGYPSEYSL